MSRQMHTFHFKIKNMTEKAFLLAETDSEHWIPRSRMTIVKKPFQELHIGDLVTVMIEEWLARAKGLL